MVCNNCKIWTFEVVECFLLYIYVLNLFSNNNVSFNPLFLIQTKTSKLSEIKGMSVCLCIYLSCLQLEPALNAHIFHLCLHLYVYVICMCVCVCELSGLSETVLSSLSPVVHRFQAWPAWPVGSGVTGCIPTIVLKNDTPPYSCLLHIYTFTAIVCVLQVDYKFSNFNIIKI